MQLKATDSSSPQQSVTGPETITIGAASPLSLGTGTLPNGTVGVAYSATIGVTGGTSPYSCIIVSGTLPAGLVLGANCLVSGTPTTAETTTVQVEGNRQQLSAADRHWPGDHHDQSGNGNDYDFLSATGHSESAVHRHDPGNRRSGAVYLHPHGRHIAHGPDTQRKLHVDRHANHLRIHTGHDQGDGFQLACKHKDWADHHYGEPGRHNAYTHTAAPGDCR